MVEEDGAGDETPDAAGGGRAKNTVRVAGPA